MEQKPITFAEIDISKVVRAYSGRRGCMCGCRGNYSETKRSISIIAGKLKALEAQGHQLMEQVGCCYYLDTETRTYALYYSK